MRLHILLLAPLGAAVTACGFEDPKRSATTATPDTSVVEGPLFGRWCEPSDTSLTVAGRALDAAWFVGAHRLIVERRLDGVMFERQTWTMSETDMLATRTLETPAVFSEADEAFVRAHPIDDLQALVARDDWSKALPGRGDDCDVLPSAYGHGYPLAEGWYVAGTATEGGTPLPGSEWYGHGGQDASAPFAPAKSKLIELVYDDEERMIEERLDRGAVEGGPHDLLRTRVFDPDGMLGEDRMERWSPTPKEDIVRVMSFASVSSVTLERSLVDTFEATLDVRFIPRPLP